MFPRKDFLATRRMAMKAALSMVIGGLAAWASTRTASAQEKLAQNLVQYQNQPKDGAKCSACVNWQAPNACTIVAGEINPEGWCVAYAPKES